MAPRSVRRQRGTMAGPLCRSPRGIGADTTDSRPVSAVMVTTSRPAARRVPRQISQTFFDLIPLAMQLLRQKESERYRSRKVVHRGRAMSSPHGAQVSERCLRTLGPRRGVGGSTETSLGRGQALLPTRGSLAAESGPRLEVRIAGRRARPGRATVSQQIERTLMIAQPVPWSSTFPRVG